MYFFIEQGEYQFFTDLVLVLFLSLVDCNLFTRQETEVLQSEADLSLIQANVERENRQQVIFTKSHKKLSQFLAKISSLFLFIQTVRNLEKFGTTDKYDVVLVVQVQLKFF